MSHRQHRCVPAASFPARLPLPVHIKPLLPPSLKPARHACTRSWWPRAGHGSELWPKSLIRHVGASSSGCQGQGHGSWSGSTASRMNAETTQHPTLGHVWAPFTRRRAAPPPTTVASSRGPSPPAALPSASTPVAHSDSATFWHAGPGPGRPYPVWSDKPDPMGPRLQWWCRVEAAACSTGSSPSCSKALGPCTGGGDPKRVLAMEGG